MTQEKTILLLIVLSLILLVIAYQFFGELLFEQSLIFKKSIQAGESIILNYIFYGFSLIGGQGSFVVAFLYYISVKQRKDAFKFMIMLLFVVYIQSFLKLVYAKPRPYLIDSEIKPILERYYEYGLPSGHSYVSLFIGLFLLDQLYLDNNLFKKEQINEKLENLLNKNENTLNQLQVYVPELNYQNSPNPKSHNQLLKKRILASLFTYIIIFLIGFSRIYLGMHSLDQVLFGWFLGFFQLIFYKRYLEDYLDIFFNAVQQNNPKLRNLKLLIIPITLYTLAIVIPYILHLKNIRYQNISDTYKFNLIKYFNDDLSVSQVHHPSWKCLGDCNSVSVAFGFFIGFILQNQKNPSVICEEFRKLTVKVHFIRSIILLIAAAGPYFLSKALTKEQIGVEVFYFGSKSLSGLISGFAIVKILPIIMEKYHLTNVINRSKEDSENKHSEKFITQENSQRNSGQTVNNCMLEQSKSINQSL